MDQLRVPRPNMTSMRSALAGLMMGSMIPNHALADAWSWQGEVAQSTVLDIELVRGHVRVERAPRADVQIEAVVSDPAITLNITHAEGRLQVRDFYRVRSYWFPMHECLPPPGEHGDFADGSGKVELVLHVPLNVVVHDRVLSEY
jgi:hypothetical protein